MDQNLWEFVDEVVTTPIEHVELRSRLENLRRIRDQSIAVAQKTEQLLLLNRITRHDIRNEMNVITGWAGQLEDHVDEAGQEICERVLDSSHNVVDLTRAVREFVEILEMDDDPELKPIALENALADEIVKRRSLFEDAEFVVDGEIPPVQIQANELLLSVPEPVKQFRPAQQLEDARVTVTVTRRTASVVVTIADNGPGIPSDRRDAVLGRTEDGLDHPSAGVGLYLVDTLVEQYGVPFESLTPPTAVPPSSSHSRRTPRWVTDDAGRFGRERRPRPRSSSSVESARIYPLVAEDGNHRVLKEWLSEHDFYRVVDAGAGLETAECDLCIVDHGGLRRHADELRRVKSEAEPALFPVLLLLPERRSGIIETDRGEIVDNVFGTTVDEIVSLPIRRAELGWRIKALLRLRDQSLQLQRRTEQLRRFKEAVEASGHAVYITDPDGTIEYVNPAFEELTGYEREEAIGQTPNLLNSGEMPSDYFTELWETVLGGSLGRGDRRPTKRRRALHRPSNDITDHGRRTVQALVAIQADITELIELHRQLRVVDQILRHNLRNNLTVIRGQAEQIQSQTTGEAADAAEDISTLSDNLLTTSQKSRAITDVLSEQPDIRRIDIVDTVTRSAGSVTAGVPDVQVDVDVPTAIVSATTNIHKAIEELIENAIVHNDTETPAVSLSVTVETEHVEIRVIDNGNGIPEMDRAVLESGDAIDDLYHGSGLGLWLVYWIIKRSGGSVAVEKGDTGGTTVRVTLPTVK
ncbi:sensor histidine kinase [Natrialba swarupiae]|nr:sensor histidine kinase [Natrialba swarupiae]